MSVAHTYLGCYFDTLGQKELYASLRKWYSDGISLEDWNEILRVASESRAAARQFSDVREEIKRDSVNIHKTLLGNKGGIFDGLPIDRFLSGEPSDDEFGVQPFSDGILMYVATDNLWAGLIFVTWITRLSKLMVHLHSRHISIRGAISVGKGWPVRGGSIVGPLVESLDRLERSSAIYSRIIATSEFKDYVLSLLNRQNQGTPVDTLFFIFKDLLASDTDGCLIVDYLSPHMVHEMKRRGRLADYVAGCMKASGAIGKFANSYENVVAREGQDVAKSAVAWKYRLLQVYYEAKIRDFPKLHSNVGIGWHIEPIMPIRKPEEYYVCYLRIDELPMVPEGDAVLNCDIPSLLKFQDASETTATILSQFIGQFNANRDEWLNRPRILYSYSLIDKQQWPDVDAFVRKASELAVGVEQIGNYVLFYVRNQSDVALLCFVGCVLLASRLILDAMSKNHYVRMACVKGIGWENEQDALMGTCIEDAHRILSAYSFYPRLMIAPDLAVEILGSKSVATFLGGQQMIFEDVDGMYFWDYLSEYNRTLYQKVLPKLDYAGTIEFVYTDIQKRLVAVGAFAPNIELMSRSIYELNLLGFWLSYKMEVYGRDASVIQKSVLGWIESLKTKPRERGKL